jgi:hypothetical protein
MRRERNPDDRLRATLRVQAVPSHPYEATLWQLHKNAVADDTMQRVVDIYEDLFEREQLQAWIFAGANNEDIHKFLGVSIETLEPYRHLCCNLQVFRDKLELMRWISRYNGSHPGKLMLERAIHHDGLKTLTHLVGQTTDLDPQHVVEQVMRESYYRGLGTMRATNLSSAEAAAAHQLMKTATASATAAQQRSAPSLAATLLKLKHREVTWHVEDITSHGEILH